MALILFGLPEVALLAGSGQVSIESTAEPTVTDKGEPNENIAICGEMDSVG